MDDAQSTIKVFTEESVHSLRELARKDPAGFYGASVQEIFNRPGIKLIQAPFKLNPVQFKGAELFDTVGKADVENAVLALEMLPELTSSQAADDRLWVTLANGPYKEYARSRFPMQIPYLQSGGTKEQQEKAKKKATNHLFNHFFADSVRIRIRDNAISRLWWMAFYAKGIQDVSNTREILSYLLGYDLDIVSSFLGRTSIAAAPSLASAILFALVHDDDFGKRPSQERRENFRNFMKQIDLLAGRRILAFLPREELQPEISKLYENIVIKGN
jgi:hypothetical protein